jgi:hypothetical protein
MRWPNRPPQAPDVPALGPRPEPICAAPGCLMCVVKHQAGETRSEFVTRLQKLYLEGRLW